MAALNAFAATAGTNVLIKSHLGKQVQEYGWHWYSLQDRCVDQISSYTTSSDAKLIDT